jgi:hypothetical protein
VRRQQRGGGHSSVFSAANKTGPGSTPPRLFQLVACCLRNPQAPHSCVFVIRNPPAQVGEEGVE